MIARAALALAAVAAALAAAPSPAAATVICSHNTVTSRLAITSDAAGDRPAVVRSGLQIAVSSDQVPVPCQGPAATVGNTDKITFNDTAPGQPMITVDLSGGPLAPGKSGEGQFGTAEIEIEVDAAPGARLRVIGSGAADTLTAGTSGGETRVNLNTGELIEDADVVATGVGLVTLIGEGGHDRLDGRGGAGTGNALDQTISVFGGDGDDQLAAGAQSSLLEGADGDDRLLGGPKRDNLTPGAGDDQIDGQEGTDLLMFDSATDGATLDLTQYAKQDTGEGLDSVIRVEEVLGTDGDDVLRGNAEDNRLTGASGDDLVEGREGNDTLEGGAGADTATYGSAGGGVSVLLASAAPQATGAAGQDVVDDVENVTGGPYGDTLAGDGAPNRIDGGAGSDAIEGEGGADVLDGGRGAAVEADGPDLVDGGPGTDTLSYGRRATGVAVTLDGFANDGAAGEGDQDVAIENAAGGAGDDTLWAPGTAVNTLTGGLGDDVLDGGRGSDRLDGGPGTDTLSYAKRTARVAVRLDGARNDGGDPNGDGTSGAGEERDLDVAIENATGGTGADRLRAAGDVDNLMTGGGGADVLDGGFGTDVLDGGPGIDTISYAARVTAVAVTLNGLADDGADPDKDGSSSAGEEADQDIAIENATGGAGHDKLEALLAAASVLTGGAGNDRLDAKDGSTTPDHLDCGPGGVDIFVPDPVDTGAGCEAVPAS